MTLSNIFASLPKVYLRSNTVNKTSFKAQFQPDIVSMMMMTILVVESNCLSLPALDRKVSSTSSKPRQRQIQFVFANKYFSGRPRCAMENLRKFGKFEKIWKIWENLENLAGRQWKISKKFKNLIFLKFKTNLHVTFTLTFDEQIYILLAPWSYFWPTLSEKYPQPSS